MASNKTGGPAFPIARDDAFPKDSEAGKPKSGMSLRDYFAAKAMQGLLAQSQGTALLSDIDDGASYAYKMADAMLRAREE
jgi:hypothetical protein